MTQFGCLPIVLFFILLFLLPLLFGEMMIGALLKLRLTPDAAILLVMGIFIGSMINVPIKRIVRDEEVPVHPLAMFGLRRLWPGLQQVRRETVIAVNVGGCLIPASVALYETWYVCMEGAHSIAALLIAVLINTAVCYRLARPVEGVGIAIPGLIPPVVAALCAVVLAPQDASPVAFVAGVMGSLLGADLLHFRDISRISAGLASIGGAGTFDGIVLSGILAAYLA
jgi:uncharacterized membrane protein